MALFPPVPAGLLYTQTTVGSAVAGNTAAGTAKLICAQSSTQPLPALDQGYFPAQTGVGKTVRMVARGLISFANTASVQTFILGFAFATSDTTTVGTTLAATGTTNQATSLAVSNAVFELEADIVCQSTGTSGAFQCYGQCSISTTSTLITAAGVAPGGTGVLGMGGSATVAMSTEQANYIQVFVTWGASNANAGNTVRADHFQLFAMN